MAKIGGMELIVILVIALFAIGPERLPKAARTLGRAVGSFKKYMNEATSELREVSEEFKDVTNEIASAQKTMKEAFLDVEDEVKKATNEVDKAVKDTKKQAEEKLGDKPETKKEAPAEEKAGTNNAEDGAPQDADAAK